MMKTLLVFALAILATGCGLKAPDVAFRKSSAATPAALGLEEMCAGVQDVASDCGRVDVSMVRLNDDDRWAYWKAGTNTMMYLPAPELVGSLGWDLRVTKIFPVVGSNGGATAADEGFPGARASFAAVPDSRKGFVPRTQADLAGLAFRDDEYASLEFQGVKLPPEYQNLLLNTIGTGILSDYAMDTHRYRLSQRVFILRTADGGSYYAIRFENYERNSRAVFTWRKIP